MHAWIHILRWVFLLCGIMLMGLAALRLTDLIEHFGCEQDPNPQLTCDIGPIDKLWMGLLIFAVMGSVIWGAKALLRPRRGPEKR
jgi:hypothetical protein